jgi:hypothetical protein
MKSYSCPSCYKIFMIFFNVVIFLKEHLRNLIPALLQQFYDFFCHSFTIFSTFYFYRSIRGILFPPCYDSFTIWAGSLAPEGASASNMGQYIKNLY